MTVARLVRKVEGRSTAQRIASQANHRASGLPPDRKRPRKHTVGSATHDLHRTGLALGNRASTHVSPPGVVVLCPQLHRSFSLPP